MSDVAPEYVPDAWDPTFQRFLRDDDAENPIVSCYVFDGVAIYETEEEEL